VSPEREGDEDKGQEKEERRKRRVGSITRDARRKGGNDTGYEPVPL
jgi:hypothetical protein